MSDYDDEAAKLWSYFEVGVTKTGTETPIGEDVKGHAHVLYEANLRKILALGPVARRKELAKSRMCAEMSGRFAAALADGNGIDIDDFDTAADQVREETGQTKGGPLCSS